MIDIDKNKNLNVNDHICFIIGNSIIDGIIKEKNNLNNNIIDFKIEVENNKFLRIKHNKLNLYQIYKK